MDPTAITPTQVQTSIPSVFSPTSWAQAIGGWTSRVEADLGITGSANSNQAVAAATPPGQPSSAGAVTAVAATATAPSSSIFTSAENAVSGAYSSVTGFFSGVGSGVTSITTGLSADLKYIAYALIAFAVIYLLATLRTVKP